MIAMGDNVKQNQMLLDILERCVIRRLLRKVPCIPVSG